MNEIVGTTLASVVITSGFAWLCRNWLIERLRQGIKYEYDEKLERLKGQLQSLNTIEVERLKAELSANAAIVSAAHKSLTESYALAHKLQTEGIARLWKAFLNVRNSAPAVLAFLDILAPSEYSDPKVQQRIKGLAADLTIERISKIADEMQQGIEEVRPFIGEYLWALFFVYQAIMLRISFLAHNGQLEGRYEEWFKDGPTVRLLENVATPDEMQRFHSLQFGQIDWTRKLIEGKFLITSQKMVSGKLAVDDLFFEAQRIAQAVAAVKPDLAST
ncbi:MAG TPA: hypothetical protein VF427_15040 [Noviherbaspirillum sp.]